jgi:hypothetical protein
VVTVQSVGPYVAPGGYFNNDPLFADAGEYFFLGFYDVDGSTPKAVVAQYNGGYGTPLDVDITLGTRALIAVRFGAGTLAISRDGGAEATLARPDAILQSTPCIGKTSAGSGNYGDYDLHELLTFNTRKNDADHAAIIAGLMSEWGI